MSKWRNQRVFAALCIALCLLLVSQTPAVWAFQSQSSNYAVNEAFFGTGGVLDASSENYRSRQSAGELTVGEGGSENYKFHAGFNTTDVPLLEFAVNGGSFDMGVIDATTTGVATATFRIRNYLSSGYIVIIGGHAPAVGYGTGNELDAMTSAAQSQQGTEQFGVNLVANTLPAIGADTVQVPDNTFSYGYPAAGYDQPNYFKFVPNDPIALSNSSSGQTDYTLSMITNASRISPSGSYTARLQLQVVPTF